MFVVSFPLGIFIMQNSIGGRVRILTEDRILGGQIDSSTLTPSRPLFFCNPIFSLLLFSGTSEGIQHGRSCESDGKEGFPLIPPLLSCHESGGQVGKYTDLGTGMRVSALPFMSSVTLVELLYFPELLFVHL